MFKAELDQLYEQNFVLKWKLHLRTIPAALRVSVWIDAASKEDADFD